MIQVPFSPLAFLESQAKEQRDTVCTERPWPLATPKREPAESLMVQERCRVTKS